MQLSICSLRLCPHHIVAVLFKLTIAQEFTLSFRHLTLDIYNCVSVSDPGWVDQHVSVVAYGDCMSRGNSEVK